MLALNRKDIYRRLTSAIEMSGIENLSVIPWACPVPYFGNLDAAKLATVGLNPSNREFVSVNGNELSGNERRFPTLSSLGLKSWAKVSEKQLKEIDNACSSYFFGNPYDWFKALDKLIAGSDYSFYGMFAEACHLDLCPFATFTKWGELTGASRQILVEAGGDFLGNLIVNSEISTLILNGQTVIRAFEAICQIKLNTSRMDDWTLPRTTGDGVDGFSYFGRISKIGNLALNREILILGYSHNIQSSFGVTSKVRESIASWITKKIEMT